MQVEEQIRRALAHAAMETTSTSLQPAILMSRFINHDEVGEYTSCYVNGTYASRLKTLIDDGWIVFRIQTEFQHDHVTLAYLAKMRVR